MWCSTDGDRRAWSDTESGADRSADQNFRGSAGAVNKDTVDVCVALRRQVLLIRKVQKIRGSPTGPVHSPRELLSLTSPSRQLTLRSWISATIPLMIRQDTCSNDVPRDQ